MAGLSPRAASAIGDFWGLIEAMRRAEQAGASAARNSRRSLGPSKDILTCDVPKIRKTPLAVENAELHAVALDYVQTSGEVGLAGFLERVALVAISDQLPGRKQAWWVTLMTVHTAKGLEFRSSS